MSHQVPEDRKLCTGLGIWHFGPREDFSTFRLSASRAAGLTPTSCSPFLNGEAVLPRANTSFREAPVHGTAHD